MVPGTNGIHVTVSRGGDKVAGARLTSLNSPSGWAATRSLTH